MNQIIRGIINYKHIFILYALQYITMRICYHHFNKYWLYNIVAANLINMILYGFVIYFGKKHITKGNKPSDNTKYQLVYSLECTCGHIPREKDLVHCNTCNYCVEEYDHHCFYLSVCVHKKNRELFLLFLCSVIMLILVNTIPTYHMFTPKVLSTISKDITAVVLNPYITFFEKGMFCLQILSHHVFAIIVIIKYVSLALVSSFTMYHIYIYLKDTTTYKMIKSWTKKKKD